MEYPDFIRQLHGVNDAERIALERQRDFKYTGADAVQRPGDIRLAALRDRQGGEADGPGAFGKAFEFMQAALIHETGRVFRGSAIGYVPRSLQMMLSYVTTVFQLSLAAKPGALT